MIRKGMGVLQGLRGKCKRCGRNHSFLTRHSPSGHHKPPYILICPDCHKRIHQKLNKAKNIAVDKNNFKDRIAKANKNEKTI